MADKFQLKAIISAVDKLSPTLKGIALNAKITKKSLLDIKNATSSLLVSAGVAGAALGAGLFASLKKIVGVSAEFERFETILQTIEGSAEKAKASMGWIQDFAVRTPYELGQVTDSFVKLKAYGIDPTNGSLEASGNAAAAMGKDVMQAVEALADAMTGENERLKEFGIKASKSGDKIKYSWSENGKTMVATAKASSKEQIEAVVTGIWNRRFGGAMDKLSGTWEGLWSNMSDQMTKFIKKIGSGGIFDTVKGHLKGILTLFDKWEADGTLDRIAKQISGELISAMNSLGTWVKSVDWAKFYEGVKSAIVAIIYFVKLIVGLIGDIANLMKYVGGLTTVLIVLGLMMIAGPVLALAQLGAGIWKLISVIFSLAKVFSALMIANPIILAILVAIALVAGAAYLIYKNWAPIKAWFIELWESIKVAFNAAWDLMKTLFSWSPLGLIIRAWGPVADFFKGIWENVKGIVSAPAPNAASSQQQSSSLFKNNFSGLNNSTNLNGEMTVRFENAPAGMRAGNMKTNQTGLKTNVDVGMNPLSVFAL